MQSGRDTLASIDHALQQVRGQIQELDSEIQSASTQLVTLRQAEAACYRQLAQLRVGQLVTGEIMAGFDQAEQRVGDLLTQREHALQALQQHIAALQTEQQQLEAERTVRQQRVATLCCYHNARPNYAMLLDIPVRLRQHAQRVRAAAEQEFAALTALERTAAEADGIPALREVVEEAEQRLDAIDVRIQEKEEHFRQLMDDKAAYAAGEDALCRQAISALVGEFEREGLLSLRRQAEATRTAEDDRIVQELAEIDQQHEALEATLAYHKQMHGSQIERLQQLEEVRRRFKRERYDDVHSSFTNAALLGMILNQFLRGGASSDALWGTMRRQQRYHRIESDPGFGSSGFGRPDSVWRLPSSSGGFGGGDFSSGGSFGGGDFQTRGGF